VDDMDDMDGREDQSSESSEWITQGGAWKQALKDAFDAEFEKKKNKDRGPSDPQYFKVTDIYVWGNNPIREYKVILQPIDGPPPE
jgi:hypothetical protein